METGEKLEAINTINKVIKAMIKIQLKKLNMKIIGLEEGIDYEPDVIQQKIDNAVNEYIGKYFEVRK